MIILHENLGYEASKIAEAIKKVYGINSEIKDVNLDGVFKPIPEFDGYWHSSKNITDTTDDNFKGKAILLITDRNLYFGNKSKEDDWIFGYCSGNLSVISVARMKRPDSRPSNILKIPTNLYLKRITALALHEIGHDVVKAKHFKPAIWVNAITGHTLHLGQHCTDNNCVMYEIVDIKAPPKEEGYMQLGNEKHYDAGLDDVLERINPDWFCQRCLASIHIDDRYR